MHNYDNKEPKLKIFKLQIVHLSNIINGKIFEQTFGHIHIKLANKVINTKNKEEYQIIVKNINKNIDKLHEMGDDKWADLYDAVNPILEFNERY